MSVLKLTLRHTSPLGSLLGSLVAFFVAATGCVATRTNDVAEVDSGARAGNTDQAQPRCGDETCSDHDVEDTGDAKPSSADSVDAGRDAGRSGGSHAQSDTSDARDNEDFGNPIDPLCGNGEVDPDEECDDGAINGAPDSPCTERCEVDVCGNGHRGPNEECDDGNQRAGDSCEQCHAPPPACGCGDGVAQDACAEECDEGADNGQPDSTCTRECKSAVCGDGLLSSGEECDEGEQNGVPASTCDAACKLDYCGNGFVGSLEQCDDGNDDPNDACAQCLEGPTPSSCGDGILDEGAGEECDLGALNDSVGGVCTFDCKLDYCGNGHRGPDEECDDANAVDDDSCGQCMLVGPPPSCGDDAVDEGEQCDLGTLNGIAGVGCTVICRLNVCGDGHRGPNEDCDDANGIDLDACPNSCVLGDPTLDAGVSQTADAGDAAAASDAQAL